MARAAKSTHRSLRGILRSAVASPARRISVIAADNHPLILRGIASVLGEQRDIALTAQVLTGPQALSAIVKSEPDVALLNLRMPERGALDILEELHARKSNTRAVILTTRMSQEEFLRAVQLGVRGVVLKNMPPEALVDCVRTVDAGGEYMDRKMIWGALEKLARDPHVAPDPKVDLTPRERAVLVLTVRGLSNKDIARTLSITEGTVKSHLHRSYVKLGVRGRVGMLRYAQQKGIT